MADRRQDLFKLTPSVAVHTRRECACIRMGARQVTTLFLFIPELQIMGVDQVMGAAK